MARIATTTKNGASQPILNGIGKLDHPQWPQSIILCYLPVVLVRVFLETVDWVGI